MISLVIFTNVNSFSTFVATIESFFDKCENAGLIDEIIHVDDRSSIKNRDFYVYLLNKFLNYRFRFKSSKIMSNNFLIKIQSQSLGDTLAATPTLRKLYNSYDKKFDVITHHAELFKNNKYINNLYSFSDKINENSYKEIFNTFIGVGGKKNEYGVEKKHNTIDIRQFHALDLGFMLNENEMQYDYIADKYVEINNLPQNYICLHVANTWPSRTYSDENWQKLINIINEKNIAVVLIGKNSQESGFYNIDKPTKKLNFKIGLDLTNQLDISQCWHVINKSEYFITMDSGLLHLAGTTDTNIIQLGSSINNKLRAPYRNGSQNYKYKYVGGSCDLFCASDIKYGVKEWKTIQGIPPLIKCLENKKTFECHPAADQVFNEIKLENNLQKSMKINKNYIELTNFDKNQCIINYRLIKETYFPVKIKIIDNKNGFIIYQETFKNIIPDVNYWTCFVFAKNYIHQDVTIIFESNDEILYQESYRLHEQENHNIFSEYRFEKDLDIYSYLEIFGKNLYRNYGIEVEPDDVVVDIGCNVGAFIKYANDKKAKKIFGCEPNNNCVNIINKYYENVNTLVLNEFAISDKDGETFLQIDKNSITSGCSKILESKANHVDHYKDGVFLPVRTITFNNFIKINKIDFIDFLKIDCEGGEVFIFTEENKEFFANKIKKIVLEYHNEKKNDIVHFLKSINYDVHSPNLNDEIGMIYAKNKLFS